MNTLPVFSYMEIATMISKPPYTKEGVILPSQTHSGTVIEVETGVESLENCDALITKNRTLTLGVYTADCAPICISDGERIAIIHAGWRGLCGGIIEHTLGHLGDPQEVFVGPHLHSFTVQKDYCYDAIVQKFGGRFLVMRDNQYVFEFKDAIASRLPESAVFDTQSTATDSYLPSYRHKKSAERVLTAVCFPTNAS